MQPCTQEPLINRINKEVFGNGQKGLSKDVTRLKTEYYDMKADIETLSTCYVETTTSINKIEKLLSNREAIRKALGAGMVKASLILGMFGTVITLAILIFNNKPA